MFCGHTPKDYWCRPSIHWSISSYYGAEGSNRVGDQFVSDILVNAGEGHIRITTSKRGEPIVIQEGSVVLPVRKNERLCIICKNTKNTFQYVFWNTSLSQNTGKTSIGGRYGLVLRTNDYETMKSLNYCEWKKQITRKMITSFNKWFKSVCSQESVPQLVKKTQRYFEQQKFNLPASSGE